MRKPFNRIWRRKSSDLKHWIYYNIFIGLSPVLLSWFFLILCGALSEFVNPFLDGTFLVFTATLSGASISFFSADTKLSLLKTERYIFNGLLAVIIFGSAGYAIIVTSSHFSPGSLNKVSVFITSVFALILAIYFNLYLAGVRMAYADKELMNILKEELAADLAREKAEEEANFSKKAHAAKVVDGAKL